MMHNTTEETASEITSDDTESPKIKGIPEFHEIREDLKKHPSKIEDTKKIMDAFRKNTENYPKYLSYDGSLVLCVLLSLTDNAVANKKSLPIADQEIINSLLPKDLKDKPLFEVAFDKEKDFILMFPYDNALKDNFVVRMFNSIIHPSAKDLPREVSIEDTGDKIIMGKSTSFNKKNIQILAGVKVQESSENATDEKLHASQKHTQAGKNAYEIRADVLQMAIEWLITTHIQYAPWQGDDAVIELAKKFYKFVENKR